MGIRAGVTLIELAPELVVVHTRRGFVEIDGLPFEVLQAALSAVGAGGRVELAAQLRRLAPAAPADDVVALLASQGVLVRGASTFHSEDALRRAIGGGARLRLGPLRAADLGYPGPVVQLTARSWRISGAQACIECAALWEIQTDRSPSAAAQIANARVRRRAIALGPDEIARIARALRTRPDGARWIAGDHDRGRIAWRRIRRAAACSRCPAPPVRDHARTTASSAAAAGRAIQRLGLAWREERLPARRGELPSVRVIWGSAFLHRRRRFSGRLDVQLGVGVSAEERTLISRAELIERASALLREPDRRGIAARDLGEPYLPLQHWALYSAAQYAVPGFPFAPVDTRTPLDWMWAQDARRGDRLLVPAALTMTQRLSTPRFVYSSSNGVATHTDRERALRSALLELIERDALQRAWYLGRGARSLDPRSARIPRDQRAYFERGGWALRLIWIRGRADLSVVAAIAERVVDRPPFPRGGSLLAAAAAGDVAVAVGRALRELRMVVEGMALGSSRSAQLDVASPPQLERFWRVDELIDIARLYLHPAMRPAIEAFGRGPAVRGPDRAVADDAHAIVERLHRRGHRTLVVDLSNPLAAPFVTVQAIVLGTQPLGFGTGMLRLGSRLLPPAVLPREPPLPRRGLRIPRGALNPYILPLS